MISFFKKAVLFAFLSVMLSKNVYTPVLVNSSGINTFQSAYSSEMKG